MNTGELTKVRPMKLYLGGQMTGIPQFNFPAFDTAAGTLRDRGYDIVSPAELDDPKTREAALASPDGAPGSGASNGETWGDFLARDVKLIADEVDGAVFMEGWQQSRGARLEALVCTLEHKPVFLYDEEEPTGMIIQDPDEVGRAIAGDLLAATEAPVSVPASAIAALDPQSSGEVRITDPTTGGQKGQKIERFDLIPPEFERQLALVYGAGSQKYDDNNWRKGYSWLLSLGALRRHLNLWQRGELYDDELTERAGEPVSHLAAVAWHCATLMVFEDEGLGTDDLPERAGFREVLAGLTPNNEEALSS